MVPDGGAGRDLDAAILTARALLLEGKANLLRLRQEIPLNDDEVRAVDEGITAHEELAARPANVPTPDGETPRQIDAGC